MPLCERCPNKHIADSIRLNAQNTVDIIMSIGGGSLSTDEIQVRAEKLANEIESKGCGWFWGIKYRDKLTGVEEVKAECGIVHLRQLLLDQGALTEEALQAANIMRDQTHSDLISLVEEVTQNTRIRKQELELAERVIAVGSINMLNA